MDPTDLIDHPPRDDDQGGPVDLVGPVLMRIRSEPAPVTVHPGLPLLAVLATMVGLGLGIEWLARQVDVQPVFTALPPAAIGIWSFGDLGVVVVVLVTLALLMGRRVTA